MLDFPASYVRLPECKALFFRETWKTPQNLRLSRPGGQISYIGIPEPQSCRIFLVGNSYKFGFLEGASQHIIYGIICVIAGIMPFAIPAGDLPWRNQHHVDGRYPAFTSWGWSFSPSFTGFYTSQVVVRDFWTINSSTWNWIVGILVSFWEGPLAGAT